MNFKPNGRIINTRPTTKQLLAFLFVIPFELRYKDSGIYKHYVCSICMDVCNMPRQCKDGHLFCFECIQRQIEHSPTCPECRQEITMGTISRNLVAEKQIENLLIWCRYHFEFGENKEWIISESGCNESMSVLNLPTHEKQCQYAWFPCPFSLKCGKIRKKDMIDHEKDCKYRTIICEFCLSSVQLFMLEDHLSDCTDVPIKCSYCSDFPIKRGKIENHENYICPEFLILCHYRCKERIKRKNLLEHDKEFVAEHLNFMRMEIIQQHEYEIQVRDKKIQELNMRVEFLNKKIQSLSEGGLIQWKLEWREIEKAAYIQRSFCFEEVYLTIMLYPDGDTEESSGYISLFLLHEPDTRGPEFVFFQTKEKRISIKKLKYYFEIVNHLQESKNERSYDIVFSLYPNRGESLMKGNRTMMKNNLISKESGFLNEEGELWINIHIDHIKTFVIL